MNEPCRAHERVVSPSDAVASELWMSYVIHMDESCGAYELVVSRSDATAREGELVVNESWRTYGRTDGWLMPRI